MTDRELRSLRRVLDFLAAKPSPSRSRSGAVVAGVHSLPRVGDMASKRVVAVLVAVAAGAVAACGNDTGSGSGTPAASGGGTGTGGDGQGGVANSTGTSGGGGSGAEGGSGGSGGAGYLGIAEQSCSDSAGMECNGESCCTSILLPGGSFLMGRGTETCSGCIEGCPTDPGCSPIEKPEHAVTLSAFYLDKYEVTVGRFRVFVEAGAGTQASPPAAGSGAHPLIGGSGWDSAWNTNLPADQAGLVDNIACHATNETWTPTAEGNEQYPMNCVNWYEAFAFCIWDGGRLPTEAEWEYAAAGGEENRVYPWGNEVTEPLPASYGGTDDSPFVLVGSYSAGNGRWGHADLAGSMYEWVLDWIGGYGSVQTGCSDCANLSTASDRVMRGGFWSTAALAVRVAERFPVTPTSQYISDGFRCARSVP